jgi:hypothetical protein
MSGERTIPFVSCLRQSGVLSLFLLLCACFLSSAAQPVDRAKLDAPVSYAGAQGLAGLDQIIVAIPRSLAGRGEVEVLLNVDAQIANTVRVNIQ